jgi:hypothetical protein
MSQKFVGVFNLHTGERYLDLSLVVAWTFDESAGQLNIILHSSYSQQKSGEGDCEFWYFRDSDMGFDALLERLRSMSEKLWTD